MKKLAEAVCSILEVGRVILKNKSLSKEDDELVTQALEDYNYSEALIMNILFRIVELFEKDWYDENVGDREETIEETEEFLSFVQEEVINHLVPEDSFDLLVRCTELAGKFASGKIEEFPKEIKNERILFISTIGAAITEYLAYTMEGTPTIDEVIAEQMRLTQTLKDEKDEDID